jgi:hypothetical protein
LVRLNFRRYGEVQWLGHRRRLRLDYALTRNWILGMEHEHISFEDGIHQGFNNFGVNVAIRKEW